jgi:hypothetical protein
LEEDTKARARRTYGYFGQIASTLLALAALVTAIRGTQGAEAQGNERVAKIEEETRYLKEWLSKIETKLDRVIEERRSK